MNITIKHIEKQLEQEGSKVLEHLTSDDAEKIKRLIIIRQQQAVQATERRDNIILFIQILFGFGLLGLLLRTASCAVSSNKEFEIRNNERMACDIMKDENTALKANINSIQSKCIENIICDCANDI